ncbi:MAG TPA: asparagine synthase C-terminal domain-containing protein, partial [Terriglobales bacterium]|nr:asparagine synthase C-terminal domain-containing protein [Terriglobales bacterium]
GQIFDRSNLRLATLPETITHPTCVSELMRNLELYWGNFALFFASREEAAVYRDPSGSVPVYHCHDRGAGIFVSNAAFAAQLGVLDHLGLDERFVTHWLQYPFLRTRRTGLERTTELLPGMLLTRRDPNSWVEVRAWHPSDFVGRGQEISDPKKASIQLRETALSVVSKQSAPRNVVLRLSGGLDSSIISACLAHGELDFTCVNFVTRSRDGDEREYARAVAASFNVKLVEIGEPEICNLKAPAKLEFQPTINPLLAPFEHAIAQSTAGLGASLLIDGGGGDNLFCSITSAAPVVDALLRGGPRETAVAVLDIAARANCTIWEVLGAATKRSVRHRPAWKEDRSFLASNALLQKPEIHPWLEHLRVPPGKREHVEALVHIQHFLDRSELTTPLLHPLLAQPLLELCLRIPSWLWMRGGRDRAIAREAFNGLLPPSVLQRRMKGSLQGMLHRSFLRLREEMRELLIEGELARTGILDLQSLNAGLSRGACTTDEVQLRISEMVALEFWLRKWRSVPAASIDS